MDELINEFLAETREGLETLDNGLIKLEQSPNDQELLGSLFRVMHTIKGTCGFLGLNRLGSVAHAGENIMDKIRSGTIQATSHEISLILQSIDAIKAIVSHLEQKGAEPEGDDAALIARLNACAAGEMASAAAVSPSEEAASVAAEAPLEEPVPAAVEEEKAPEAPIAPAPAPAATAAPAADAPAAKGAPAGGGKPAAGTQSIRVNLDVLEQLMQQVSELVLTRNQLMQLSRNEHNSIFVSPLQRLSHITTELQDGIMKTRMQPIGNAWGQYPRLIRDLSMELGKKIELKMIGEDTELDRQMLEAIKDPLTHMVRNSCDHGLEKPEDRRAAGKPEAGTVTLRAFHEGGHINVEISDDGRGLSNQKIIDKAVKNGLVSQADVNKLSPTQIQQFIFMPGFSTAEKVTAVSGRGVGMDVVRTNIESIGGTVELRSVEGKGSTFIIKIPLTLAIMPVLIIGCAGNRFALPQINVTELVRAKKNSEYTIETINESPVLRLRGELLPLLVLGEVLKLAEPTNYTASNQGTFIVVCKIGGYHFGLIVDKVFDTEEIVVKPVAPLLKAIPVYSGSTILGDGSVIMILDPKGLARAMSDTLSHVDKNGRQEDTQEERERDYSTLLVFRAGGETQKVVPLELVSRLEEIKAESIEVSGGNKILQYRGNLMRMTQVDDSYTVPKTGELYVIVFAEGEKIMGLIIEEILDIVKQPIDIPIASTSKNGFLGSVVVNNKTCDLVDITYYFHELFSNGRESAAEQYKPANDSRHLLLVDDSPFFRKFIPPTLVAAGYSVTAVEDASKALDLLEKGKEFSLIITDMNMPGMSGKEFVGICKHDDRFRNIPIIALSSHTSDEVWKEGEDVGVSGYVSKTSHNELVETIGTVLSSLN